jgi:hypothetical protein
MDPELQKLFSSAGIQLGKGGPQTGSAPTKKRNTNSVDNAPENEAVDEQEIDAQVPTDSTDPDTQDSDDELGGGSPESDIFRAIVEGGTFEPSGPLDFSFLPQEFRDQVHDILVQAINAGDTEDDPAGASVG